MKKSHVLKLTIPGDLAYLSVAQLFVRETAKKCGFEGNNLHKIALALEEALTNVMKHAFEEDENDTIDIICDHSPLGLEIIIKEKGIPFDPEQLPEYSPVVDLESAVISGMGIFLMRESVDEVSFHNLGTEGKETRLFKYLPSKNIEAYLSEEEQEEARTEKDEPSVIKEKIAYDVRRMEPEEAIQISRCAYKSHGYTFFDDHIYYPDRLVELNAMEQMISAVAVTKENVFMGHSALHYPYEGARIAELTFIFVNKEYRGQGCMARLNRFLFECPKKYKLDGVYSYSVTNHEFTQRGMLGFGLRDCGLLLASSPETWVFKGIADENLQRISVALSFKYLLEPNPLTMYAPPHHLQMIRKLYENIGASCHNYATPDAKEMILPEEAQIDTEIFTTENCAEISIIRYGKNTIRELKKIVRELCLKNIAAIQLFLRLEDPQTYFMASEFESMDFFFSGILPFGAIGDTLILQYLNNVEIDYDKIVLYAEAAKEIRDYIRQRDPNLI